VNPLWRVARHVDGQTLLLSLRVRSDRPLLRAQDEHGSRLMRPLRRRSRRDRPEGPLEHSSPAAPLEIVVRVYGSTSTVTVGGDFDVAVAEQLAAALHGVLVDAPEMVLLDLSAVTFIDVAGVRAVERACRRAQARSAHVTIIPGADRIQRIFRLTGLESRLPFARQALAQTESRPVGPPLRLASQGSRPPRDAGLQPSAQRSR
jgi:anti-anti-sigma factor